MRAFETIEIDPSVIREAESLAGEIGLTVEEVVKEALEHGIVDMRSAQFFKLRRAKGSFTDALEILRNAGKEPPLPGDEIPEELVAELARERR